ncbi:uncharacterized protein BO97DRAFT_416870 [Aspergillus homomorphus CBS 101889]|uniref:Uncharacterized protein n=1 Tax=Aspergillus homomorphus (strain CBS 101889) TaxID=1450537 RepID=A0A395HNH5_ASPHC|nr:hypothetical protein BO97DRAFT_416870 [Aspergillus homomorphus CBS 101889]RAL09377.1 hypothetical protein BO97DRAFT_416870 [Aspergillus homomorphus CBS 101889]
MYLRKLFRDLFIRESLHYNYVFEWTVYKYQENAALILEASGKDTVDKLEHVQAVAGNPPTASDTAKADAILGQRHKAIAHDILTASGTLNTPRKEMSGFFDFRLRSSATEPERWQFSVPFL